MHRPAPIPDTRTRIGLRLFVISIASLYLELMMIRWLPSEIRILAYFSNVTLISCILGLGLGALMKTGRALRPTAVFLLLALTMLVARIYHGFDIALPLAGADHFVWNGLSRSASGTLGQYVALFGFVALTTTLFIPLGQILGQEFDRLPPIPAYLINVVGALLGLSTFALFSLLALSPFWWFVVGVALVLPLVPRTAPVLVGAGAVLAIAALGTSEPNTTWSPYYKVRTQPLRLPAAVDGFDVSVNEDSHQQAIDLSGRHDAIAELATRRRVYDEPYRYGPNERVLILGAGTGNDVAAALRAGASQVDAVDIDPVILELGRRHPERPYSDPRVTVWNREARTFLRQMDREYDKIVLGYVDSHALFSAMSSVRLDNFVYTVEAFREMAGHLSPQGVLAVTFTIHEQWIANRIHALFDSTFGAPPIVYQGARTSSSGTVFLGGAAVRGMQPDYIDFAPVRAGDTGEHTWHYHPELEGYLGPAAFEPTAVVPTDNWPYLYLRDKATPVNYWLCMLGLLVLAFFTVKGTTGLGRIRWPFFFLGAAFLLVETKAMTEVAIFLGSTWTVNYFVITTILALIVLGTVLTYKGWVPRPGITFMVLTALLIATYVWPVSMLLGWESPLRGVLAVTLLCLPLLFAAMIFAEAIRTEPSPSAALGSNLLGAIVGGVLEYSSMQLGLQALYLAALGLYLLAWLTFRQRAVALA